MRLILPMMVLALILILPDLYIIKSFLKDASTTVKLLQWCPTILMGLLICVSAVYGTDKPWAFSGIFAVILCFGFPKFIFMILSILGKIAHIHGVANCVGVLVGSAFSLCCAYGLAIGWRSPVMREVDLHFKDLPAAFDGYTLIQISDWHLGTYSGSPSTIRKEVQMANDANADAIVFTGDIVNGNPDELDQFLPLLSTLKAKDGVFSVMGNHDYCMYGREHTQEGILRSIGKLQESERSIGWRLLLNENEVITRGEDKIAIVGVENDGNPPFPQKGDLDKAQRGLEDIAFKVLLSHDPTHWRRAVLPQTDIQLTLSGHTHAMQFRIGKLSPSRLAYREWGGLYSDSNRKLYVSTGSGGNVSFRFGAWPEIVKITLHKD